MTDSYAPLSQACIRALTDKMYEKRKRAALEIEKMVRDFNETDNTTQIKKLLKILGQDFALSQNPNTRKGGLIGLASVAVALGHDCSHYIPDLVKPIIVSLVDQDSRVKYYACEALYNVVKVARGDVMPLFNDIFDALTKVVADPDQNVKNGAELIDGLLKDIVTESASFDLVAFIPLLRERLYSRNPFSRQFIVSWIALLDNVPDVDMIIFLPELLEGLFVVLGDPTVEIRRLCEIVLTGFLCKIIANPARADFAAMVNVLIIHSQSEKEIVQFTAITWLKEFVKMAGHTSLLPFSAGLLTAIIPCLAQIEIRGVSIDSGDSGSNGKPVMAQNIKDVAMELNESLMDMVTMEEQQRDELTPTNIGSLTVVDQHPLTGADTSSADPTRQLPLAAIVNFDLSSIVEVLVRELKKGETNSTPTKKICLRWIKHLHVKVPHKIMPHLEESLFPILLLTLLDPSPEVAMLDLEVLAQVFKTDNQTDTTSSSFNKFMLALLNLFKSNPSLLEERGSFIIRQLCVLMSAEDIYKSLSTILLNHEDLRFSYTLVQSLNKILFTTSELYDLRSQLKDLQTDESCALFCCLYRTWCHSPVATVSLCLLTKNYKHCCDLLMIFGELDITVEFLQEIDQLVQLIESPIFAFLRLHLLDTERNFDLVKCLYGLLMLLPQGEAFHTLRKRLQCVPNLKQIERDTGRSTSGSHSPGPRMDFKELIRHFQEIQSKHKNFQRQAARQRFDENR